MDIGSDFVNSARRKFAEPINKRSGYTRMSVHVADQSNETSLLNVMDVCKSSVSDSASLFDLIIGECGANQMCASV